MGLSLSHNVDSIIGDVGDVKNDIGDELYKRVSRVISMIWADAKQYVLDDPHVSGELFRSIENDVENTSDGFRFSVSAGGETAPYAAIIEYGSGQRTRRRGPGAQPFPPFDFGGSSSKPPQYPFDAPDTTRYQLAPLLADWMQEKGLTPKSGSYYVSALGVAREIVRKGTYAHPYLRPAWFDNELKVKRAARNALRNAVR